MSALVRRLAIGRLSPAEEELVAEHLEDEPEGDLSLELREQLLYQHLYTAQQARLRMEAARSWSREYHAHHLARERAIARAARHYHALSDLGAPIDALLTQMATTEGIPV